MFNLSYIITVFLVYMLILFLMAYYAEKNSDKLKFLTPYIYSLSLAIYCTAWTYYGSVGKVSSGGLSFLAVYLGPTLMIFLWPIILRRLIKIKNIYKVTSIADLISARYDKSMFIGAFVSFAAVVGIIPYISIQLKAIIQSISILVINENTINSSQHNYNIDQIGILIVILMSFFTIIFGLRKLDPSERHFGMIFIVAVESIVKLFVLIVIGIFVSYFIFDDITSILKLAEEKDLFKSIAEGDNSVGYSNWISIVILSMFAIVFLPRQFHVSVVENSDVNHIKTAMWLFPLYLLLITFFTIPIALGGSLLNINHELNDFYVLTIPLNFNKDILSIMAFIGGFSASTSMIMVTSMAMSIMVSNYLILPLVEHFPSLSFLKRRLLLIRWIIVTLLIFLSYLFYLYISKSALIVNIGLISFTAILQFAPVIIGALFWSKANKYGAISALIFGFIIWFYTLVIPQFANNSWISFDVLNYGLFGFSFLKPTELFGFVGFDSIPHAVFWSMIFNISSYIIISLLTKRTQQERKISNDFINILRSKKHASFNKDLEATINTKDKLLLFENIFNQYLSSIKTNNLLDDIVQKFSLKNKNKITIVELSKIYSHVERLLSGTLGTAGANNILRKSTVFTEDESIYLSNIYANILKNMKITPEEFSKKINFLKEKDKLLQEHYSQLKEKIIQRDKEIQARQKAEIEIKNLNESLENQVEKRTHELSQTNKELKSSMLELKKTQNTLIEAEKMASLGELVAGVAHEINTPIGSSLTGITHFISISEDISKQYKKDELEEEDFKNYLEKTDELARSININLQKTAKLVKSFKEVAVDQSSDNKRVFKLKEYLDEILLSLKNITKKTKINIHIICEKEISISGYPGAISQIFTNLIMNTLNHAYKKGEEGLIDITIKEDEKDIYITYSDYGKGISEKNISKIFNPFFSTNREKGNSGLGLSIIYNLVTTKLNGKIICTSKPNEKTSFEIIFPK